MQKLLKLKLKKKRVWTFYFYVIFFLANSCRISLRFVGGDFLCNIKLISERGYIIADKNAYVINETRYRGEEGEFV